MGFNSIVDSESDGQDLVLVYQCANIFYTKYAVFLIQIYFLMIRKGSVLWCGASLSVL